MEVSSPTFEASLDVLIESVGATVNKLQRRNRLASSFQFAAVKDTNQENLFELHNTLFPITWLGFQERIRGHEHNGVAYSTEASVAIEVMGELRGAAFTLPLQANQKTWLFALIVDEKARKSSVTPLLKLEAFKRAQSIGAKHLLFQANESNADTLRHAKRVGARRAPELD